MTEETILLENKEFIYYVANRFKNYAFKDDLFQAGCIGMIEAWRNFDASFGAKFTTYAFSFVYGQMSKLVREDKGYKVSRDIAKLNLQIERAHILLTQKFDREPSFLELATYLDIDEFLIAQALHANYPISSIDEPRNLEGKEVTFHDTIADGRIKSIDDLLVLRQSLKRLSKAEQQLINSRYVADLTQSQTGYVLGMSQVQVSRAEGKVLSKLRDFMIV
ncbi:MAG: sigma-70 family RNA polymerase sigma factor [Bacilli bacterium]